MWPLYMVLVVLSIFVSSCTTYLPLVNASGTVLQAQLPPDKFTILGTSEGTSCSSSFLGFPLVGTKNTYQNAVNNAIRSKNGDHFIQATSDASIFAFPIQYFAIYIEQCITVQGLVVKLK